MEDSHTYYVLGKYQATINSETSRTIHLSWNNLVSKFWNSKFGKFPGRLLYDHDPVDTT